MLVTNVEVNSEFRTKFIETCKQENPQIEKYQIIGLDELETWATMEVELRHLYFPTIFGPPRFHLTVQLTEGMAWYGEFNTNHSISLFQVTIKNMGIATSYIGSIKFKVVVDGQLQYMLIFPGNPIMERMNPKPGTPLEPGRSQTYHYPREVLQQFKQKGKSVFPSEVIVTDEIGNQYSATISDAQREFIISGEH